MEKVIYGGGVREKDETLPYTSGVGIISCVRWFSVRISSTSF